MNNNTIVNSEKSRLSRKMTATFSLNLQQNKNGQPQTQTQSKVYLKLDSPRTREAIIALGMDLDSFQYKTIDDFGGPQIDEEIKQLRYQHYLKQTQKDIRAVIQKRKRDIIQSNKLKQQLQQESQEQEIAASQQGNQKKKRSSMFHRDGLKSISMIQQQLQQMPSVSSEARLTKQQMNNLFAKTTSYLEQNHNGPSIEDGEDLLELDQRETLPLEDQVGIEINRYNKAKIQKQLEAMTIYDLEVKRLRGQQNIKKREDQIVQNKIRQEIKELKQKEAKKMENMEKMRRIQYEEEKYQEQKKAEREQIKKKLAHIRERQQKEAEQKKLQIEEKKRLQEEKNLKIQAFLDYQDLKEEQELYERLGHMHQKQELAEMQLKSIQENTVKRIQANNVLEMQKAQQAQQKKLQIETDMVSSFVQKIQKNNEEQERIQKKLIMQDIERCKQNEEKQQRYQYVIDKNKQGNKEKTTNLQERFKKKEENLARKRAEDQRQRKIKAELTRLKEMELKEINVRNKRKDMYVKDKIFTREKMVQDRVDYQRQVKQFLQKTRKNISQQSKQESQRIFEKLFQANDKLFPFVSLKQPLQSNYLSPDLKKQGVSILKQVLKEKELDTDVFDAPKVKKKEEQQPKY